MTVTPIDLASVTNEQALTVACPRCHAAPDAWCNTSAVPGPVNETASLHRPRQRAYLDDPATAALRETPIDALLTAAYGLTHRMDAARRDVALGGDRALEGDLRAQRDLITAEIVRRSQS